MFVKTKREGEVPTKKDEWRTSFLRAADLLEQHGWCQERTHNDAGEHCLLGAVYFCRFGQEAPKGIVPIQKNWSEVFDIMEPYTGKNVAKWNDNPHRTKAEVIAVLRAAATD